MFKSQKVLLPLTYNAEEILPCVVVFDQYPDNPFDWTITDVQINNISIMDLLNDRALDRLDTLLVEYFTDLKASSKLGSLANDV